MLRDELLNLRRPVLKYSIDKLHQILESLPESDSYLIGYSGGMDSHVLLYSLHALSDKLQADIRAVHVNHGLSNNAPDWEAHCRSVCNTLDIELLVVTIDARSPKGESPESWARYRRYTELAEHLREGEVLLTAHHKNDQVETLLLQLFRGCGPDGLAAMPLSRSFGSGWHCRPLLEFSRDELQVFARETGLVWVEDESNQDVGIDRNYIRHQLLPAVREHWPGVLETLSRSARHQAEASQLLDQLGASDLAGLTGTAPGARLSVAELKRLSVPRQKNLLRYWLHQLRLPIPDAGNMRNIISDLVNSRWDAMPCITWHGVELRRYRDYLYAAEPMAAHDPEQIINWDLGQPVAVANGRLNARRGKGNGIKTGLCRDKYVEIRYRRGGETIQPHDRKYHHELKKLLQENAVPPWLRDRVPLLYIDGSLAAVPGKWIAAEFMGDDSEECWQLEWEGMDEIFPSVR